jgi:DGQHR domain-containing protein
MLLTGKHSLTTDIMAKKRLSPAELKLRRETRAFKSKIVSVFKNIGFEYLNTENIHRRFGLKVGELDYVFVYENIIIVCEDTISTGEHIKRHIKNKKLLTHQIIENAEDTINWLKKDFPEKFAKFDEYDVSNYKIFHLYFSKNTSNLSAEDIKLYQPIKIIELGALNYFYKLTQNIRLSARNEIFRFLGIGTREVGHPDSSVNESGIETTIIYPVDTTGLKNNIRLVSFMMSADKLLKNSFVLRKDNWEESTQLYQRLIEKARIQSIRKYLANNKSTFLNNIIVSLPPGLSFKDKNGNPAKLTDISGFDSYKMYIPDEANSICIIDGQHRIFAHYEGEDNLEKIIKPLRNKLHLLVTGLIFPSTMSKADQRKYESEIFLDINTNAKPVPPDVLLHIETIKDPFSSIGVARQVLVKLNKEQIFLNYFQLSLMEESKIKIASIIKFALKNLVDVTDDTDKESLFNYWGAQKQKALLEDRSDELLEDYVDFASKQLDVFFSAVKASFTEQWKDPESKILSTTSINGFIMALAGSLEAHGLKDLEFYRTNLAKLKIDFSKEKFPYTSSQYRKFSKQILDECFALKTQ